MKMFEIYAQQCGCNMRCSVLCPDIVHSYIRYRPCKPVDVQATGLWNAFPMKQYSRLFELHCSHTH